MITFDRQPDRYQHWKLSFDGPIATLAMDEVMYLRSASTAIDLAQRALAAGLPLELHRGGNWCLLALGVLAVADRFDEARQGANEILTRAPECCIIVTGSNAAPVTVSRAVTAGARGFLLKPYQPEDLVNTIRDGFRRPRRTRCPSVRHDHRATVPNQLRPPRFLEKFRLPARYRPRSRSSRVEPAVGP